MPQRKSLKLDPIEVERLLRSGVSQAEIAQRFGVSRAAVSICVKKNKILVQKATRIPKDARTKALVKSNTDFMGRLAQINNHTMNILDVCERAISGDAEALEQLDSLGAKDKLDTFLKTVRAAADQIKQAVEIGKTIFDVNRQKDFEDVILAAIMAEEPEIAKRIIKRIENHKDIEKAVRL